MRIGIPNTVFRKLIPMPPIRQLTTVLDTTITCTFCRGAKICYDPVLNKAFLKCPNCLGTGKMIGRTKEEQHQLDYEKRDYNLPRIENDMKLRQAMIKEKEREY